MLQYTTGRRLVAVLLTMVVVGMLMSMSHRLYDSKEVEAISELLSGNRLTGGEPKCSLVATPVATVGHFARFFPTDATLLQKSIDQMDDAEMLQYMHWSDRASCYLSYDFGGVHIIHNGITGIDGQKAVCMDRGVRPMPSKCLVYSIGIATDWSFDELMERYGCEVYAMDPSIGKEDHNHSAHVHFFNMGLGPTNTDKNDMGWKMRTFSTVYEMLKPLHGDMPIDILKADIEGAEFDVIPLLIESGILDKVKQIALEVHLKKEKLRDNLKVLKALEDKGFVRFAIRPNIFWPTEIHQSTDHFLYEMAWYNIKYKELNPIV